MYTNADSLINKRDEFLAVAEEENPDIIVVTEILPKNTRGNPIQLAELQLPQYDSFTNLEDRKRGVCLYVKKHLKAVPNCNLVSTVAESVWCEVSLKDKDRLLIGGIYRSPNGDDTVDSEVRELLLKASETQNSHILIMGDFNYPEIKWEPLRLPNSDAHPAFKFVECLRDCFFYQHVHEPTHVRGTDTPNVLDLIITNEENMVQNINYEAPLGKSHHNVLTFNYHCYTSQQENNTPKFIYHKGDYDSLRKEWHENIKIDDPHGCTVQQLWDQIEKNISDSCHQYIPVSTGKPRPNKTHAPWNTAKTKEKIKQKKEGYKIKRTDQTHQNEYSKLCNQVKWECRKAKSDFEKKIAQNAKKNPKHFYKYVQSKVKVKVAVGDLLKPDGGVAKESKEKADTLNNYFSSVFTVEDTNSMPDFSERNFNSTIETLEIKPEDVEKKLNKLNTSKAAGPDGISPRVLKELSSELAPILTILMNKSIEEGTIPQQWKNGHVTPIFKKGSRNKPDNYRPVTLTVLICRTMESFVRDVIMNHLLDNLLLSSQQHGFIIGKSCVTQLLACMDIWTKALDDGLNMDIAYMDFRKAFDSVPHKRLLKKLHEYGVRGKIHSWIENFLSGRKQRVVVDGVYSDWTPVTSGIPQGSVLGPLLFLVFINDMPEEVVNAVLLMFADDTKIMKVIKDAEDNKSLQKDLDSAHHWSSIWQLYFNEKKCKLLHIGRTNEKHTYHLQKSTEDGETKVDLEITELEKDLGVHVDPKLNFSDHTQQVVSKGNSKIGLIRRSFTYLDAEVVRTLYTSLVRPSLEYANAVWSPMYKKDAVAIENVQRRATKLVPKLKNLSYEARLKSLNLPSMYYRRARGDMIETFKFVNGIYKCDNPLTFDSNNRTRGHQYKLKKERCRLQVRQNFFSNRVVDLWNNLPASVVEAVSVNAFKNKLDRYWRNAKYVQDFLKVNHLK